MTSQGIVQFQSMALFSSLMDSATNNSSKFVGVQDATSLYGSEPPPVGRLLLDIFR